MGNQCHAHKTQSRLEHTKNFSIKIKKHILINKENISHEIQNDNATYPTDFSSKTNIYLNQKQNEFYSKAKICGKTQYLEEIMELGTLEQTEI